MTKLRISGQHWPNMEFIIGDVPTKIRIHLMRASLISGCFLAKKQSLPYTVINNSFQTFSNAKQDFFFLVVHKCFWCSLWEGMMSVGAVSPVLHAKHSGQQVMVLKRNWPDFSGSLSSSMVCFMASLCCWKLFPVENKARSCGLLHSLYRGASHLSLTK